MSRFLTPQTASRRKAQAGGGSALEQVAGLRASFIFAVEIQSTWLPMSRYVR
jgi:hypothetical protein